jgi:hypothetical protein
MQTSCRARLTLVPRCVGGFDKMGCTSENRFSREVGAPAFTQLLVAVLRRSGSRARLVHALRPISVRLPTAAPASAPTSLPPAAWVEVYAEGEARWIGPLSYPPRRRGAPTK